MIILFEFETLHIIQHSERYEFYHVTKDGFYDNQNYVEKRFHFSKQFSRNSNLFELKKRKIFLTI